MPGTLTEFAIAAAILAFLVVVLFARTRRRLTRRREFNSVIRPPIDMADLHAMLQAGTITPAEFERLKAVVTRPFATRHEPNPPLEGARGFDVLPPVDDRD